MKILVVTLSNIGDVILTFPVLDALRETHPSAEITVLVGPKGVSLLEGNPHFDDVQIYDKHQRFYRTVNMMLSLRKARFDMAVDLRHTAIPLLAGIPRRLPVWMGKQRGVHMRQKHFNRARQLCRELQEARQRYCLHVTENDKILVQRIMDSKMNGESYFVMSPGAADHVKRWPVSYFARAADHFAREYGWIPVFVGDHSEAGLVDSIIAEMKRPGVNLCGEVSLVQLAHVLAGARFCLANDSAPMHMASYLDVPVCGLFGPTDPGLYGPWGKTSIHLQAPRIGDGAPSMSGIALEDVLRSVLVKEEGVEFDRARV